MRVRAGRFSACDGSRCFWLLDGGRIAGLVFILLSSTNRQCLWVGELQSNILLLHSWEFSMQLIVLRELFYVELGTDKLVTVRFCGCLVVRLEILEKSEERTKGGRLVDK